MRTAVAENASRAFEAFYDEAHARFGLPYPDLWEERNPDWEVFLRLAVLCLGRGWDVETYVHRAFDIKGKVRRCMLVGDLLSNQMTHAYENLPEGERDLDVREEYDRAQFWLINREIEGSDERPLLMAVSSPLPAWFRVLYSEKVDPEIADMWGEPAKKEFLAIPQRMELAKKLFPDNWEKLKRLLWVCADPEKKGGVQ